MHPSHRRAARVLAVAAAVASTSAAPALAVLGQYPAMVTATVTPTASSYFTTNQTIDVENDYLPNVVLRENGAASYQALLVQAVAARGYLYYRYSQTPNGGKGSSIVDGTAGQVYSKTGTPPMQESTAASSQLKYFQAADETEREILMTNWTSSTNEPICTFYVAAGKPDTAANTATYWPGGAPLGQWETGDSDPTSTETRVTYNLGLTGSAVHPTSQGSSSNPVNRGSMSQNGSNFLGAGRSSGPGGTFAGWNYVDILKYYYGQDAQLVMTSVPTTGELPGKQKVLASFDFDEGYYRNSVTFSGSNQFLVAAGTSHARDTTTFQAGTTNEGSASQRVTIDYDSAADAAHAGFTYRHVSGMVMGTLANPTLNDGLIATTKSNVIIEPRGSFGFWVKTTTAGLAAAPALDEGSTSTMQGLTRNLIADGQWHKYEWFLTDVPEWSLLSGTATSGISTQWTMDSLIFKGASDAVFNLDTVFFNASGAAPTNQWFTDAGGSYNFAGNWVSSTPNGIGATANFLSTATAARTVTVDSAVTVGTINFNNPVGYTVNGPAAVTLDVSSGSASVNVQSTGTHTINAPLTVNDATTLDVAAGGTLVLGGAINSPAAKAITKTGGGALTISGPQTYAAGSSLTAQGGTTRLNTNAGTTGANLSVTTANTGTTVQLASPQRLAAVTLGAGTTMTVTAGGANTLSATSLSLAGKLDLNDNDAVVNYTGSTPADTIRTYLLSGRNGGPWNGTAGLLSTTAANDPQRRNAIGYAEASLVLGLTGGATATWSGQTADATSLLLKYTWYGDATLDGRVNADDYARLDRGLAAHLTGWVNGDFDYSGAIDAADYLLTDRVFFQQGNVLSPAILAEREAEFGSAYVADLIASVPEPSLAVTLATALPAFLLIRPRHRQPT